MEWKENRKVIMTKDRKCIVRGKGKDRKCIVRGKGKDSYILCVVGEQSRYRIKDMVHAKYTIEKFQRTHLPISEGVKKLYNTESCWYSKELFGELEEVKIECIMRTI